MVAADRDWAGQVNGNVVAEIVARGFRVADQGAVLTASDLMARRVRWDLADGHRLVGHRRIAVVDARRHPMAGRRRKDKVRRPRSRFEGSTTRGRGPDLKPNCDAGCYCERVRVNGERYTW